VVLIAFLLLLPAPDSVEYRVDSVEVLHVYHETWLGGIEETGVYVNFWDWVPAERAYICRGWKQIKHVRIDRSGGDWTVRWCAANQVVSVRSRVLEVRHSLKDSERTDMQKWGTVFRTIR
jgi:hypothetical protein